MDPTSNHVSTNPIAFKNNRSSTATMEFPATTTTPLMTNSNKNHDIGDKKPTDVTPSPIGTRLVATRPMATPADSNSNRLRHITMDYSSSEDDDDDDQVVKLGAVAKKSPPPAASASSSGVSDNEAHAHQEQKYASFARANKKPSAAKLAPATDEKAKARQARLAALGQHTKPAAPPRRQSGMAEACAKNSAAPPPLNRVGSNRKEDPDVIAKRRARAQASPAGVVRKCPPPTILSHSASHSGVPAANKGGHRTAEDPDAFAKRRAKAPTSSENVLRKCPPPTILSASASQSNVAANKGGEENPDALAKRRARAPPPSSANYRKLAVPTMLSPSPSQISVASTIKREEDPDVATKRQARPPSSGENIRRLQPPTVLAQSSSQSSVGVQGRRSGEEDPDVVAKRQGRAPPSSRCVRNPPPPPSMVARVSSSSSVSSAAIAEARMKAVGLVLEDDSFQDEEVVAEAGLPIPADADAKAKAKAASGRGQRRTSNRRHTIDQADAAVRRNIRLSSAEVAQRGAPRRRATLDGQPSATVPAVAGNNADEGDSGRSGNASELNNVGAFSVAGSAKPCKHEDAVLDHLAALRANQAQAQAQTQQEAQAQAHQQLLIPLPEHDDDDDDSDDEDDGRGVLVAPRVSFPAPSNSEPGVEFMDEDDNSSDTDSEDELEAQAGVAVAPGAFQVNGLEAGEQLDTGFLSSEFDDAEREDSGIMSLHHPSSGDSNDQTFLDPNSHLFMDPEAAAEARQENLASDQQTALDAELVVPDQPVDVELYTATFVDAYDESGKFRLETRLRYGCVGICFLLAIIAAIMVALSQLEAKNRSIKQEVVIPKVEGWNQLGTSLNGPTDDDKSLFGYDVAMDGQAQRIAIGVPGHDQGEKELLVGQVHILDWNGTEWAPHLPILGPGPESQAGSAVAISRDGKRVAVGSPYFASGGGHVAVYEEVAPAQWDVVGQILVGDMSNEDLNHDDRFGSSLALSYDGNTLAIGANMGDGTRGVDMGYVKVFQLQQYSEEGLQQQWIQLGNTIYGENPGDFFGWSLDISSSGKRLVAGAVGSFGGSVGEFTGQVRAFDYNDHSRSWTQAGPALTGVAAFDSFGSSVSLSGDGATLAVGAIGHSNTEQGLDIGHVRVFEFSDTPTGLSWQPLGQTLVGQSSFDSFGYSVSLSQDGKVVAAGGPRNDEFAESSGQIQVFALDEATSLWTRRGSNIGGSYEGRDLFGWAVSLSSDGAVVAGGAPFSSFDGRLNDVGTVRIYDVADDE